GGRRWLGAARPSRSRWRTWPARAPPARRQPRCWLAEAAPMKLAGSRSWRFAAEASALAHLALRVRDAAGLQVPQAGDVPPPLAEPPQPVTAELDLDPVLAGADWLTWWRELVALEGHRQLLRPDQVTPSWRAVTRDLEARQKHLAHPPRFEGLSDRPGLQAAARAVGRTPHGWVHRQLQA